MIYRISFKDPSAHFIDIELEIDNPGEELEVQLPAWRPGRYQLADFAKNVQRWGAFGEGGKPLTGYKVKKDRWRIEALGENKIYIRYNFYANVLDGGSTLLDEKQLYVNPVNCFIYIPERMNETCKVELSLPKSFEVATAMERIEKHQFSAGGYHRLADCPFIASPSLKHHTFEHKDHTFHLWFQGECKPDIEKMTGDFKKIIGAQYQMMKEFPFEEYHFYFQITPYKAYHGVEHVDSTVILLGPSYDLMAGIYNSLLGITSHELFHIWNVKTIRPVEMMPYDYSKENYSRLGYVAEGATTYYGDQLLLRAGLFSDKDYFEKLSLLIQRHVDNFGRYNLSVAESSFDTWLDGYEPGIPNRKLSIYSDGALIAFMTDILIMKSTNNQRSLDDVFRLMNEKFGKKQKGYTEADYKKAIEEVAGALFDDIFDTYVWSANSYVDLLNSCLEYVGLEMEEIPSDEYHESHLGIKISTESGKARVTNVYPGSVAEKSGLEPNDEILAINGYAVDNDVDEWTMYFKGETVELSLVRKGAMIKKQLPVSGEMYYKKVQVKQKTDLKPFESANFNYWKKRK